VHILDELGRVLLCGARVNIRVLIVTWKVTTVTIVLI